MEVKYVKISSLSKSNYSEAHVNLLFKLWRSFLPFDLTCRYGYVARCGASAKALSKLENAVSIFLRNFNKCSMMKLRNWSIWFYDCVYFSANTLFENRSIWTQRLVNRDSIRTDWTNVFICSAICVCSCNMWENKRIFFRSEKSSKQSFIGFWVCWKITRNNLRKKEQKVICKFWVGTVGGCYKVKVASCSLICIFLCCCCGGRGLVGSNNAVRSQAIKH